MSSTEPKGRILLVDDEAITLNLWKHRLGKDFDIITTTSAEEALTMLEGVSVIIADQHMEPMNGNTLLSKVLVINPLIIRILFSAGSDLGLTQYAVNNIGIFRFIIKDESFDRIRDILISSLDLYKEKAANEELLEDSYEPLSLALFEKRIPVFLTMARILHIDEVKLEQHLSMYPTRILCQKKSDLSDWQTSDLESSFIEYLIDEISKVEDYDTLLSFHQTFPNSIIYDSNKNSYYTRLDYLDRAIYNTQLDPDSWQLCSTTLLFLFIATKFEHQFSYDSENIYFLDSNL
jgi:CheY-like chemotaxis protein